MHVLVSESKTFSSTSAHSMKATQVFKAESWNLEQVATHSYSSISKIFKSSFSADSQVRQIEPSLIILSSKHPATE